RGESEIDLEGGWTLGIAPGIGAAQIASGDDGRAIEKIPTLPGGIDWSALRFSAHQFRSGRENAVVRLQGGRLRWIRGLIFDEADFQLSAGLNDGFRANRIAFTREFNNDFVFTAAVRSDDGFGEAKLVNAALDRLDRLRHGALLNIGNRGGPHIQQIAVLLA